ncbi:MAG: hypothetical protein V4654_12185 [Bdellovibrionota bacterium]
MLTKILTIAVLFFSSVLAQADDAECIQKVAHSIPRNWPGAVLTTRIVPISVTQAIKAMEGSIFEKEIRASFERGSLNFVVRARLPHSEEGIINTTLLILTRNCKNIDLYPIPEPEKSMQETLLNTLNKLNPF